MAAVDRVLASEAGNLIKQTVNESTRSVLPAPPARVWGALVAAYGQLGISPTVADRAGGLYGNRAFVFSARLNDRPSSDFFSCGSGLGGVFGSTGRLTADVQSRISPQGEGSTVLLTHVSGRFRSNEGTSTSPITCESTGEIEQFLLREIKRMLALPASP